MAPAPSTPGKSISNNTSNQDGNVSEMQRVLANRHYLINDSNAAAQHADFLAEIKAMLIGDRRSAMAPASVKKIQTAYDDYKDCNEPTFLAQSLPALLKDGRIPKTNDGAILENRGFGLRIE